MQVSFFPTTFICFVFTDFEPITVSDWSFDENCLFCCLRRDKVKVRLFFFFFTHSNGYFYLCVSDVPNFSDPHIPVVAREILQRMISQFAAEYTSKTSSPQDSRSDSPPANTLVGAAQNQNPVLSKLLMADQDAPLDLTIKKPTAEPHEQGNGVLDLSIKRNRCSSNSSISSPISNLIVSNLPFNNLVNFIGSQFANNLTNYSFVAKTIVSQVLAIVLFTITILSQNSGWPDVIIAYCGTCSKIDKLTKMQTQKIM
uniref:Uncharacterized protein n=1 Tax=Xiphophorus couchianus TaxID=32473 RepID=A0A3B5M445_9TELE